MIVRYTDAGFDVGSSGSVCCLQSFQTIWDSPLPEREFF